MRTNQTQIRARIILATAGVLFLAGCGGTTAPQAAPPAAVPIVVNVVPTTAWVTVGRSDASISGNYAFGTLPLLSSPGTSFASGLLSADGVGNLSRTLATKAGTQAFAGTYSVAANGRTMLSITPTSGSPSNLAFYLVSASKAVGVQMDDGSKNAAVNVIEK